jgi:hypothetical protein
MRVIQRAEAQGQLEVVERRHLSLAQRARPRLYDNTTLSVLIRFHSEDRLPFLEEAIFSLAIQDWSDIETVVVLQNATEKMKRAVKEIINHQPWQHPPRYKVLFVNVAEGVDGRSVLLNEGIKHATGRYLAFLDDDDFVYQHGYTTLIEQLKSGGRAVAVGGCRRAKIQYESNHWCVQTKDNFFNWGRSRFDIFKENFVPIHSYVIDRSRTGSFDLSFDDSLSRLEDYDFLLRLFAEFEPDFNALDTPVCEYRIRTDGSNSIAHTLSAPPSVVALQRQAQQFIFERKKSLIGKMPPEAQVELTKSLAKMLKETPDERTQEEIDENSRVLFKLVQDIYLFFSEHPWWEEQFSKFMHAGWKVYKKYRRPGPKPKL